MERARINETLFRTTAHGREALAPPGEGGTHVHYTPHRRAGLGCVTSRPPGALTDEEYLALEHGLTLAQVRAILREAADGGR